MTVSDRDSCIQALYAQIGPALLAYARSILRDSAEAEDAVQHVFLKLLSSPALPLPAEPRPYLFRAVRNTSLNRHRSAGRAARLESEVASFVATDHRAALVPDLEAALADLPDEQRQVVTLRIWGELTIEESAAVLGIPSNTVASRYRYALAKLRQRFAAHLRS
jgi:RNA polymerase sigma-70 factor (ECF subfamily)